MWQTDVDDSTLAELGLELGADVPVFVRGRAAFAEGIGERLTPVDWPERHGLLVVPPVHVSTPAVFADAQLTRNTPAITIRDDLAPVACRLFPEVAEAMQALDGLAEFEPPRLSGSGGGVFAFDTLGATKSEQDDRRRLATNLDEALNESRIGAGGQAASQTALWQVWPFKTLNRSSLFDSD